MITNAAGASVLGEDNMLKASGAGITAEAMAAAAADCKYYRLTMHKGTDLGFWWGAENGVAFALAANKAYLAVPTAQAARAGFIFDDATTTGIAKAGNREMEAESYYTLDGQKVEKPTKKGLYIVNGKKMIIK